MARIRVSLEPPNPSLLGDGYKSNQPLAPGGNASGRMSVQGSPITFTTVIGYEVSYPSDSTH